MQNSIKIVNEIIDKGYLKASLYNNGIIEINWEPSLPVIDVVHFAKMQEAVRELGGGQKMPLLFIPHDFLTVSKEGGKYATSHEGTKYSSVNAVLTDNVAKKLLLNFYQNINKSEVPIRGFSNKEEAIKWLSGFK